MDTGLHYSILSEKINIALCQITTPLKGCLFVYFRNPKLHKPTPVSDTSTVLAAGSLQSLYEATPASWTEEQPDDENREKSKDTKVNE